MAMLVCSVLKKTREIDGPPDPRPEGCGPRGIAPNRGYSAARLCLKAMLPLFDLHLPTLTLVVCVVLFTAAATMTLVGRTQRTYLGYGWWTTAQWLNTAGAICLVLKDHHPWLLPVSVLLTLQWPLTMLGGLLGNLVVLPLLLQWTDRDEPKNFNSAGPSAIE